MKRFHVHMSVDDLDQSIRFYSTLFASQPTVVKSDYARDETFRRRFTREARIAETVKHLDGQYTAFGQTADAASLAVVQAIGQVPTGSQDRPKTPVTIKTARVIETPRAK